MERIDREYAIIYVDRDGECLKAKQGDDWELKNFTTNAMVTDYYDNPGFLQWNYYLIVPKELVADKIDEIENNDHFTRKFIIESDKIDAFINDRFPPITESRGEIILIKGNNWKDAVAKALTTNMDGRELYPSFYRDSSLMEAITQMDIIRAALIKCSKFNATFYTHIINEFSIAEKKFKLFSKQEHASSQDDNDDKTEITIVFAKRKPNHLGL